MNHDSFNQFMARWQHDIYRMISARTRTAADVEDIMQEVLLKLYRGLGGFRGESQVKTWIYRVVKNAIIDYYRKPWWKFNWLQERDYADGSNRGSAIEQVPDNLQPSALTIAISREERARLVGHLDGLSPTEREYFILRFLDDYSLPQMAAATGQNLNTIKTHLYRAVKKMQSFLAEELS
ncbi:MAG: RNA polymerase sigma factor [Deltaproteobacteria bacterium]|nr:RNA polymerase sigma factor [Candidatus Anaeroferrophillus wilburensis]MBN2889151.1 RNA polymerase sigma factor [Deltaproteobacteria bacterium]